MNIDQYLSDRQEVKSNKNKKIIARAAAILALTGASAAGGFFVGSHSSKSTVPAVAEATSGSAESPVEAARNYANQILTDIKDKRPVNGAQLDVNYVWERLDPNTKTMTYITNALIYSNGSEMPDLESKDYIQLTNTDTMVIGFMPDDSELGFSAVVFDPKSPNVGRMAAQKGGGESGLQTADGIQIMDGNITASISLPKISGFGSFRVGSTSINTVQ